MHATDVFDGRWRWLTRAWFVAAIIVLVGNDHVLKAAHSGWWTGKLSDLAGVVVVGVLASVVLGVRLGIALTAVGFVVLKMVPGVATPATFVLGGPPVRDMSDLLALTALVPVYRALAESRVERLNCGSARSSRPARVLAILTAALAVAATTATSCAPSPAVTMVIANGGSVFALLDEGFEDVSWARSDDGGDSWNESDPPPDVPPQPMHDTYADPGPLGLLQTCDATGTCWRLRDRVVIEQQQPGEGWVPEYRLGEDRFSSISTGCRGGQIGVLGSIATVRHGSGTRVIAALGAGGVLVRRSEGQWDPVSVLGTPPPAPSPTDVAVAWLVIWSGPVAVLARWLIGPHRSPKWRSALLVTMIGWLVTIQAIAIVAMALDPRVHAWTVMGRVGLLGACSTIAAAALVARSRPPARVPVPPRPDHA